MSSEIKFPKSKRKGSPTPYDYLVVCPKCKEARWTIRTVGLIYYCGDCNTRVREATKLEYGRARLAIIKEILPKIFGKEK